MARMTVNISKVGELDLISSSGEYYQKGGLDLENEANWGEPDHHSLTPGGRKSVPSSVGTNWEDIYQKNIWVFPDWREVNQCQYQKRWASPAAFLDFLANWRNMNIEN